MSLAVREVPGWQEILAAQRDRTLNPDRKARFEFVMPALSADPAVREQAFTRFRELKNRSHEPWVLESLRYLNHPLRPALAMLPEIQKTGDIFFPKRWMDAVLGSQRSPEAAGTVRQVLAAHAELPQRPMGGVECRPSTRRQFLGVQLPPLIFLHYLERAQLFCFQRAVDGW